jgi:hypothetical protein
VLDKVDIATNEVGWLCGECGTDHTTKLSDLVLGHHGNPDMIALPLCSCGTQTCLSRTWDDKVDLPHRRAINSLAEHLIEVGQSAPDLKAKHEAEQTYPALLADLSEPVEDLTGRERFAREKAEADAAAAAWEAERPAREAAAKVEAEAAAKAEADREFEEARFRLILEASAAINKRTGRPPGTPPSLEELNAELSGRLPVEVVAEDLGEVADPKLGSAETPA